MALPFNSHHMAIANALMGAGYSPEIAAGFVGNAMAESHPRIDPAAFNPAGGGQGALGVFQWRGDRQRALKALAANRGKEVATLDVQIEHLLSELNSTEQNVANILREKQQTHELTPEDAARLVEKHFERAGGSGLDRRMDYARKFYDYMNEVGKRGAAGGERDMLAPPMPAPPPAPERGVMDMLAMGASPDMMDMSMMDAVAPPGATASKSIPADLMSPEAQKGVMVSPNAGLASLADSLMAMSMGTAPTNIGYEIAAQERESRDDLLQKERVAEWLNAEGHNDLAQAVLNGMDNDTAFKLYEQRAKGNEPTLKMKEFMEGKKLSGKDQEMFLRGTGFLKDDKANIPDEIELAEYLTDPTKTPEQKAYVLQQMGPERANYIRFLAENPQYMELAKELRGGTDINIDMAGREAGAEEKAKLDARRIETYLDASNMADKRLSTFRAMENMLNTGMETGAMQEFLLPFKQWFADLGIPMGDDTPAQEVFNSIQKRSLTMLMSDLKGAASDFESKALLQGMAGLANTELGNRIILDILQAEAASEVEKAQFMYEYYDENNSLRGAEKQWKEMEKEKYGKDGRQIFRQFNSDAEAEKAIVNGEIQPFDVFIVKQPDGTGAIHFFDTR